MKYISDKMDNTFQNVGLELWTECFQRLTLEKNENNDDSFQVNINGSFLSSVENWIKK